MNEELSEDGYRTEAIFEGPAAWTDVDQEEVRKGRVTLSETLVPTCPHRLEGAAH